MIFNEELVKGREKQGKKKSEIARLFCIPYTTYDSYEKGTRTPPPDLILSFVHYYDIDIENCYFKNGEKVSLVLQRIEERLNALINSICLLNFKGMERAQLFIDDLAEVPKYQFGRTPGNTIAKTSFMKDLLYSDSAEKRHIRDYAEPPQYTLKISSLIRGASIALCPPNQQEEQKEAAQSDGEKTEHGKQE